MTDAARGVRLRLAAALLLVWAVAWSVPAGQVSEDTKNDLYVDPWRFLARAAHLWDPQVTWGVLQNQGYGYLFPMGPFFGVARRGRSGLGDPAAVVERPPRPSASSPLLPCSARCGSAGPTARVLGALAYTLSPRVLSTVGGLSSEALPGAPRAGDPAAASCSRRGAGSARAVRPRSPASRSSCCGGVNATATILAAVPTGLWLRDAARAGGAPRPPGGGPAAVARGERVVARARSSSWAAGHRPSSTGSSAAADVVREIDLLDVARGTTHWLGFVVTSGGEWWPAGYAVATGPLLVVATALRRRGFAGRPRPARACPSAGSSS